MNAEGAASGSTTPGRGPQYYTFRGGGGGAKWRGGGAGGVRRDTNGGESSWQEADAGGRAGRGGSRVQTWI